jgi:outer membrane immunogenic protein
MEKSAMKKLLFGSVAVVALIAANAASAADMGLPVKGRALEPEWNWSGFYAGLNAGYARGNTVWSDLDGALTAGGSIVNESNNGFVGGGQIGYNWQFRHAVIGLETDFNYFSLNQTTVFFSNNPGGAVPPSFHDSIHWFGTVRGRAGLAVDNVLTYVTAGLAYGRTNHNFIDAAGANHDISTTKVGWVAGLGAEYALDPHWSVKAEVLYADLGKDQTTVPSVAFGNSPSRFETMDTMWILRAGVNYKFGG